MKDLPLVYLAGPYTHPDPVANTHAVIKVADNLLASRLVIPVVPHLTMLWHAISPKPVMEWYAYDLHLLSRCDAVLRIPGESTGADAEVEYATAKLDIPVFRTVEALASWANDLRAAS